MARTKVELRTDLPSDENQRKRIKDAVGELVDSMLKSSAEKEHQKAIVDQMKEDMQLSPKYLKKLAKLRFDEQYGKGDVKVDLEHSSQIVADSEILFS